jgi:signal peptidase I
MEPNINPGDTIEVLEGSYKAPSDVRRGDVVVLAVPGETERLFVRRVVGLPGERISTAGGSVRINGTPLAARPFAGEFLEQAGDRSYLTAVSGGCENSSEIQVPDGSFYVLGDNRCATVDSRRFGPVSFSAIRGRMKGSEE